MEEYISRRALIAEYDRVHVGAPGGARKLMVDAPTADVAPRAEIANVIFDDIEDCLAVHAYTSKSEDYADGASDTIEWVDSKIAELRKKYMGEQV